MGRVVSSAVAFLGVLLLGLSGPGVCQDPPAEVWRTYKFTVVAKDGSPVAGATVRPWQVAYGRGSMSLGKELEAVQKTDAEGKFSLVIRKDAAFIPTVEAYGVRSFAFQIDHPEYPAWSDYVPV